MDVMRINHDFIIADKVYNVNNNHVDYFNRRKQSFENFKDESLLKISCNSNKNIGYNNENPMNRKPSGLPPYVKRNRDQLDRIRQWNNTVNEQGNAPTTNNLKPPIPGSNANQNRQGSRNKQARRTRNRVQGSNMSLNEDINNNVNNSNNYPLVIPKTDVILRSDRQNTLKSSQAYSSSIDLTGFKRDHCTSSKPTYAQKCLEALNNSNADERNQKFSLKDRFGSTQSLNFPRRDSFDNNNNNSSKRSSFANSVIMKTPNQKPVSNTNQNTTSNSASYNNYKNLPKRYQNQPRKRSRSKYSIKHLKNKNRNLNVQPTPKKTEPIVLGVTNKLQISSSSCPVTPPKDEFFEDDISGYLCELQLNSEFIDDEVPFLFDENNLTDHQHVGFDSENYENNKPIVDMKDVIEKIQDPNLKNSEVTSTMSGNHLKTSRAVDKLFWDFS